MLFLCNAAFIWEHTDSRRGSNSHLQHTWEWTHERSAWNHERQGWEIAESCNSARQQPPGMQNSSICLNEGEFLERDLLNQCSFWWWPQYKPWPLWKLGSEKATCWLAPVPALQQDQSDGKLVFPSKVKVCLSVYIHHTASLFLPFLLCSALYWQVLDTGTVLPVSNWTFISSPILYTGAALQIHLFDPGWFS